MSTRSRIGILRKTGIVESVYCHSDGYPNWNGRILLKHYSERAKIEELLKLGGLSSLAAEIGTSNPFNDREDGIVCAYHRDRNDEFSSETFPSIQHLESFLRKSDQEWAYLWDEVDGSWLFSPVPWNWDYSAGKRQKLPDKPFAWKKLTAKDCKRN